MVLTGEVILNAHERPSITFRCYTDLVLRHSKPGARIARKGAPFEVTCSRQSHGNNAGNRHRTLLRYRAGRTASDSVGLGESSTRIVPPSGGSWNGQFAVNARICSYDFAKSGGLWSSSKMVREEASPRAG